jgi:hypothetical protein
MSERKIKGGSEYKIAYPAWKREFLRGSNPFAALALPQTSIEMSLLKLPKEVLGDEEQSLWPAAVEQGGKWRPVIVFGAEEYLNKVDPLRAYKVLAPWNSQFNHFFGELQAPLSVQRLHGREIWSTGNQVEMAPVIMAAGWLNRIFVLSACYDSMGVTPLEMGELQPMKGMLACLHDSIRRWKGLFLAGVERPARQDILVRPQAWGLTAEESQA